MSKPAGERATHIPEGPLRIALAAKVRALDVSTPAGAAELALTQAEIARRDSTTQAKLRAPLSEAVARVVLPPQYRAAAEAFAELDTLRGVLESNWTSLQSGDDSHAHDFETAHFIVDDAGTLLSLADAGRLTDRGTLADTSTSMKPPGDKPRGPRSPFATNAGALGNLDQYWPPLGNPMLCPACHVWFLRFLQ